MPVSATDLQQAECICTLDGRTCGAGMANAPGALAAAMRPIATVSVPGTVTAGQNVVLQGGGGAISGHSIQTLQWTNPGGEPVTISGANTATATITAPPACGLSVVRLTVTDDQSPAQPDSADVILTPTAATTSAPAAVNGAAGCTLPSIEVALCPATASATTGGSSVAFTADVGGTANTAVTWQVNGVQGGDSTNGTISASGLYTPPACVPAATSSVSVSAVSAADSTTSASESVSLTGNACMPPPSSGGGGGAFDDLSLLGLMLAALGRGLAPARLGRYRSRAAASSHARCALR